MHHVRSGPGSPDASSNSNKRKRGSCFTEQNMDDRNSIRIKPDVGAREKCGHRYVIDLEKPATSNDDVEFVSYASFGKRPQDRYVSTENCSTAESSQLCTERNASRVSPGSVGSSDTPDCQSPIKPDNTESRHLLIDLNVPQEESLHVFYAPSQIRCPTLVNSSSSHPGDFWNGSSKIYKKECGSGVGSSKESSITVVAPSSAPHSSREVVAAYPFHDPKNLQCSGDDIHARENSQHEHAVDKLCGSNRQYFLPQQRFSVGSCGRNESSSGLQKSGDNHVACQSEQPPLAVHTKFQHDTSIVISSGEEKVLFDLNVPAESIDMESTITSNSFRDKLVKNDGSEETVTNHSFSKRNSVHAETSIEERTVGDRHISMSKDGNTTFFPVSRNNETDKAQSSDLLSVNSKHLIAESPHVDNIVWPQLRVSHDGASSPQETLTGNCDEMVCIAAETLVSIFLSSACTTDCPSQAAAEDANDEPQHSLDSYEEIVLNVEEIRDDGESIPVIPPDKDGPSCGIKLRRGRGLRNFLREIMPGLVSLSRHEICDDLHAIGYEPRKTRSRKTFGVQGSSSARGRPPKHRPTARK
ncbi:hypothetical protein E2562_006094 [Oryza meyeriana var. granulata]|uniref:Uncharacterized protein n=1 Tax=Oryza meyeriana var. granulata TaxID=110450 RepID=A0A6G1EVL6_9ORYZ|nr:hypothetical protein E2562_006094 [Oryza meyeriana var. granulata]